MHSPGMMDGMHCFPAMPYQEWVMPQPYPPMDMMPEKPDKDYLCYLEHMHRCMAHLCKAETCDESDAAYDG